MYKLEKGSSKTVHDRTQIRVLVCDTPRRRKSGPKPMHAGMYGSWWNPFNQIQVLFLKRKENMKISAKDDAFGVLVKTF